MSAQDSQVGGDHYLKRPVQPWDIWEAYPDMDPFTAIIIRYMLRWRDKGGIQDLEKARHSLDKLIEIREGYRTEGQRMADELRDRLGREVTETWIPGHKGY